MTAIVAYDLAFYDKMPKLFPYRPGMRDHFAKAPALIDSTAQRNSALQGAYFIIAARALGLDCGPMSGFDDARVDEEFFTPGKHVQSAQRELFPEAKVKSNFLCNLGYGDQSKLFPRNPRLDFNEACALL